MHAPSTRSLRALISISALALTSAAPLVTSAAHADTPQAHARAHSHHRSHDRDHDGLPNGWEKRHGLNPNRANGKADADHDGLTNRQEYKKGLNPKAGDSDHDGLKDGREVRLGTNPRSADTDHDGLKDGREVQLGTSPKSADSDHDGLKDGDEVTKYKSDPTKSDSDGDGIKDGTEVTAGTDPTKPPTTTTPPGDGGGTTTPPGDGGGTTTPPGDGGGTGGTDTTAPAAPAITSPVTGSSTKDNTPTISGTGEAGATVSVRIALNTEDNTALLATPTEIGTAKVGTDGSWSLTVGGNDVVSPSVTTSGDSPTVPLPLPSLPDGTYTLKAIETDAAGNASGLSDAVTFTVDTAAPEAPAVNAPASDATVSSLPKISGTGEPGATVTVSDGANVIGMPKVGDDSTWEFTPTTPLDSGEHTISVTQADAAGNTSTTAASRTFTVDATAPTPLVIDNPADKAQVKEAPTSLGGSGAEEGATVAVTLTDADGQSIDLGTPAVGPGGHWSVSVPDGSLTADGAYTVTATQKDVAGNASDVTTTTFTLDTSAPEAPVIKPVDDIASGGDTTPAITGTGTAGDQVVVTLNGVEQDPVDIDEEGGWAFKPTDALQDGSYTVTAVETDAAGNTSDRSAPETFTVDTQAPAAPSIASPEDGSTVTETTPTISGTGAVDGDLVVTLTGSDNTSIPLDPPTVEEGGAWSVTPSEPLADGTYTVTVSQTDAVGNASTESTSTFTVDAGQVIPGA